MAPVQQAVRRPGELVPKGRKTGTGKWQQQQVMEAAAGQHAMAVAYDKAMAAEVAANATLASERDLLARLKAKAERDAAAEAERGKRLEMGLVKARGEIERLKAYKALHEQSGPLSAALRPFASVPKCSGEA